jgi:hypothetical protein
MNNFNNLCDILKSSNIRYKFKIRNDFGFVEFKTNSDFYIDKRNISQIISEYPLDTFNIYRTVEFVNKVVKEKTYFDMNLLTDQFYIVRKNSKFEQLLKSEHIAVSNETVRVRINEENISDMIFYISNDIGSIYKAELCDYDAVKKIRSYGMRPYYSANKNSELNNITITITCKESDHLNININEDIICPTNKDFLGLRLYLKCDNFDRNLEDILYIIDLYKVIGDVIIECRSYINIIDGVDMSTLKKLELLSNKFSNKQIVMVV